MVYELFYQMYLLFVWAWEWELPLNYSGFFPISSLHIKPIQLCIAIFVVNILIDTLLPPLDDMVGNDNKGD